MSGTSMKRRVPGFWVVDGALFVPRLVRVVWVHLIGENLPPPFTEGVRVVAVDGGVGHEDRHGSQRSWPP